MRVKEFSLLHLTDTQNYYLYIYILELKRKVKKKVCEDPKKIFSNCACLLEKGYEVGCFFKRNSKDKIMPNHFVRIFTSALLHYSI